MSPDGQEPCEAAPWDYDDLADLLDEKTQRIYVSRLQGLLASVLSSASLQLQQQQPAGDSEDGRRMSMTMSRHHRRRSSQTLRWSLGKTGTRGLSLAGSIGGSLAPGDEASEATLEAEELRWHRAQIDEDILTLTCPREGCHKAFLDFDGCYALTCPGCGCGFCAACLVDCGDDAHDHCRRVHQGYFGTVEAFHVAQRARRLAAVAAYLHSLLLPPSPTTTTSSSSSSSEAPAAASSPVFLPAVAAARSPEQAAALVEALLTGPLSKDLAEVGIAVEDVRRALANSSNSGSSSSSSSSSSSENTGPNEATRLLGARDDEGAAGGGVPIRLHYTHEAAHQYCRRLLDGPGYAPEGDALGRLLGSALTGSSMVAAVWWLAGEHSEPSVLAALVVVGLAGVLLGTGRGQQVVQALYVTLLAAGLCTPVYLWGWQLFSWCVLGGLYGPDQSLPTHAHHCQPISPKPHFFLRSFVAFFRVLLLLGHALGFALDATVEGLRIMRGVGRGASQELGEVYAVVRRVAPWLEVWLE